MERYRACLVSFNNGMTYKICKAPIHYRVKVGSICRVEGLEGLWKIERTADIYDEDVDALLRTIAKMPLPRVIEAGYLEEFGDDSE